MPQGEDLLAKCRRSKSDCEDALAPLEEQRATIAARPQPTIHPLIKKLEARRDWTDAELDETEIRQALAQGSLANATGKLRCSRCNAIADAACECGVLYVRAGLRFFANLSKTINSMDAAADATKMQRNRRSGRPSLGDRPMSSTERSRRHRAKLINNRG